MPAIFDMTAFFEYVNFCRSEGKLVRSVSKALDEFKVKDALERKELQVEEEVYVVPSLTGNEGFVEINGKKFYEVL